ncbi:hypothetical protein BHE74_00022796 [Ensete ventricosum]|nr:hypothetical protein BHE74_00022796 [Ensete ventricosum]RZR99420.1 hypothetical protein BHM03_00028983 [Ensete ventricosum]
MQHVLSRLHGRRPLFPLSRPPLRPPPDSDTEVFLPRRDQSFRDPEGAGPHRCADVHHQQRPRRLPQRTPPAEAAQGRHQQLRGLRPEPARLLPLLLPRLQGRNSPSTSMPI